MAFTASGLKNDGKTAHYQFQYDEIFGSDPAETSRPGIEPARTNALIDACEGDYKIMSDWFGGINIELPMGIPIFVLVTNESPGGGTWEGGLVQLKGRNANVEGLRGILVAEVTEMFMKEQDEGWFAPDGSNEQSSGEGLSIFLMQQFQILNGWSVEPSFTGNAWLNSSLGKNVPGSTRIGAKNFDYGNRYDYVNNTLENDHSFGPASGCAILFIYYLFTQLGFPIYRIVCAAAPTLAGVYKNLTGDDADPFPEFRNMLNEVYRYDFVSQITNGDNPFPLLTNKVLSTRKFATTLSVDRNIISIRYLLNSAEMPTLRSTLNRKRRVSLL